jgi:hypothetical protein
VAGIQLFTLASYIVQIFKYIRVDVPHRVAHTDVLYWFVDRCNQQDKMCSIFIIEGWVKKGGVPK